MGLFCHFSGRFNHRFGFTFRSRGRSVNAFQSGKSSSQLLKLVILFLVFFVSLLLFFCVNNVRNLNDLHNDNYCAGNYDDEDESCGFFHNTEDESEKLCLTYNLTYNIVGAEFRLISIDSLYALIINGGSVITGQLDYVTVALRFNADNTVGDGNL